MSSLLILNDSFSTEMFNFKMLPPYCKEFKHSVQNGNTLIDRIAYKDRFEVLFPFLNQNQYNELMKILQSTTNPFIKCEYQCDELTRIWDSTTSFSLQTATFSDDPVYMDEGMMTASETTNSFTNPSFEDASISGVLVEDANIVATNVTDYHKFGSRSLKVVNSAIADWTPVSSVSLCGGNDNDISGISGEGSLIVSYGAINSAKYTSSTEGNADNAVWEYSNMSHGSTFPAHLSLSAGYYNNYMQQTVTLGASVPVLFQVRLLNISGGEFKLEVLNSSDVVLATKEYSYMAGYGTPIIAYISATTNTVNTKFRLSFMWRVDVYVSEWQVLTSSSSCVSGYMPLFIPTDDAVVDGRNKLGFNYTMPKTIYGTFMQYQSNISQSIFLRFKTADWSVEDNTPYRRRVLFCSVKATNTQPDLQASFQMGYDGNPPGDATKHYLIIWVNGQQVIKYEVSESVISTNSWHWLALVQHGEDWATSPNLKLYIDDPVTPKATATLEMTYPLINRYNNTGMILIGNRAYYDGTWHNCTFNGQYHHFDGYISDFIIANEELDILDVVRGYTHLSRFGANDFSFASDIQKNECVDFAVRGVSSSAYVARTVFFSDENDSFDACSCYIFFPDVSHQFVRIAGRSHDNQTYFAGTYLNANLNRKIFSAQEWHRVYMQGRSYSDYATYAGVFGIVVPIGETVYIDGVQIERASNFCTPYCDGDQLNCTWVGTAEASASHRSAQRLYVTVPASLSGTTSEDWTVHLKYRNLNNWSICLLHIGDGSELSCFALRGEGLTMNPYIWDYTGAGLFWPNPVSTSFNASIRDTTHVVSIVKTKQNMKLYADGVLVFTQSLLNKLFRMPSKIYLGGVLTTPVGFDGYADMQVLQFAIFDRALNDWELQQDVFENNLNQTRKPLVYYTFDNTLEAFASRVPAVNLDVRRTRRKVFLIDEPSLTHIKNRAGYYEVKCQFQES